jgi:hypothetical protein
MYSLTPGRTQFAEMDGQDKVVSLLDGAFPARDAQALLKHFADMGDAYRGSKWEVAISKAGKGVEAAVKALGAHCAVTFERGRKFKVDRVLTAIENLPAASVEDNLRITIPRALRFVYDIASNRGARHDKEEIDPNRMDATAVVGSMSWVVSELVRYAQKGAVDPEEAREVVEQLTQRQYPFIEEVEGRIYLHLKKKSAIDVALVTLLLHHPKRVTREELVANVVTNRFKRANALVAISRMRHLVDDDGSGNLRLLSPGVERAEQLLRTGNGS